MKKSLLTLSIATVIFSLQANAAGMPSQEEMWQIIQQQQKQIEALTGKVKDNSDKAETAIVAVEDANQGSHGNANASSSWANKTSIGGYGELHYNSLQGEGGASDKDVIDLHRFVLFVGHEFTDRLRFFSELEVEHAISGDGQNGEVELEQAYIEYDFAQNHSAKAGMFLLPVGIINETHEPTAFYGVERNPVEKNIIPATWWAAGLAASGSIMDGVYYDVALHEGLNTSAGDSYKPRSGRQKSSKASADDLAMTARIKYTGVRGLELAASYQYQSDITQGLDPTAGSANLISAHGIYNKGPFAIKALYGQWDLSGSGPESIGADKQNGWYIEPSWKVNSSIGLFARYNQYDNAAGSSSDSSKTQYDFGLNWWLHRDVVLKVDYQIQDNDNGKNQKGFNAGVGYQF